MENGTNGNCSIYNIYNNRDFKNVAIVNTAVAFLSLLACSFGLFVIILFKKWQFFNQRLVLYLIISATLVAIRTILHRIDYGNEFTQSFEGFCVFMGFASELTAWMILNAITAITIYLFLVVACNKFSEKYEYIYILFIFAFPFTYSWIPFINQAYGRAGVWCWIRTIDLITCTPFKFGGVLQLVLFYVPVFTILLILVILYLIILCKLHRKNKYWKVSVDQTTKYTEKMVKREVISLLAYPLICIILFIPQVCNRLQSWIQPENPSLFLWHLSGICYPLLGTIFVLTLTLNSDTRRRLRWSHIHAAVTNYHSKKVVSEYVTGKVEDSDSEEGVPYKQLNDDITLEMIDSDIKQ